MSAPAWKVGDRVIIEDYSDAHGDRGEIHAIQDDGLIIVELDEGCIWPVLAHEMRRDEGATL